MKLQSPNPNNNTNPQSPPLHALLNTATKPLCSTSDHGWLVVAEYATATDLVRGKLAELLQSQGFSKVTSASLNPEAKKIAASGGGEGAGTGGKRKANKAGDTVSSPRKKAKAATTEGPAVTAAAEEGEGAPSNPPPVKIPAVANQRKGMEDARGWMGEDDDLVHEIGGDAIEAADD